MASAKPEPVVWVDFNGTLVKHRPGSPVWTDGGEVIIGPAVTEMVNRVRRHMAQGRRFVIKSAMESDPDPKRRAKVVKALGDWSEKWLSRRLEVTATCRPEFIDQWDDKVRRVVRNEGVFADETTTTTGEDDVKRVERGGRGAKGAERSGAKATGEGGAAGSRVAEYFGEWGEFDEGD